MVFPVTTACRVMGVSRSGFYHWHHRPVSVRQQENERLQLAIRVAHRQARETYGARRLQAELRAMGFVAGRDRIAR